MGKDHVLSPPAQMVAEDANPDKKITAMWHTEYFDLDEDAMLIGMRGMAGVVWRALGPGRNP